MKLLPLILTELKGIPASGKTTMARSIVHRTATTVRVNRDDLRTMMFGNDYNPAHETVVRAVEAACAAAAAHCEYNVVVDDTNLVGSVWRQLANKFGLEYRAVVLNTPVEVAISRDAIRPGRVGEVVIRAHAKNMQKQRV